MRKQLKINFKLYIHISNRLLHKTVPRFSSELFIFYCNNSSFESVFCMKTVQRKFCLLVGCLSVKKNPAILLVQKLRIMEKWLVFGPTLILILLILGESKKGKLHILKKFGLSTFKEIL